MSHNNHNLSFRGKFSSVYEMLLMKPFKVATFD